MQAFDGSSSSKWLDFGAAKQAPAWLEYRCLPNQPAATVTRYSLVSADDEPNRDPCDFVLEGCLQSPAAQGKPTTSPLRWGAICNLQCVTELDIHVWQDAHNCKILRMGQHSPNALKLLAVKPVYRTLGCKCNSVCAIKSDGNKVQGAYN